MPEITEASLMEAFGLAPKSQGEQEQGVAAPAAEGTPADTGSGEQEQEVAAPAEESAQDMDEESSQEGAEPAQGQEMSQEERRANAARRRQQERQNEIQQAVSAALAEEQKKTKAAQEQFFRDAGLKNTFTGEAITNMAEFTAWKQAFDDAQRQKALKSGKLTPEVLDDAISRHPLIRKAQAVIDQAEETQRQQQEAADKARIDDELRQISQLDPGIKTVADILALPTASAFRSHIARGYTLLDAYRLANFDRLTASRAAAAKQEALNNARGKDHLGTVGNGRGAGAESVPPDQMRMFRMMMPEATDAQIQAWYNKHKKD